MTTKEQERKALEQIRKIVQGLGKDSYVATAFEGCFEIAEDNIELDMACSMKDKADCLEKRVKEVEEIRKGLFEENKELKKQLEDDKEIISCTHKEAHLWHSKFREANEATKKCWNDFREMEDKNIELEQEIIKLKAKLYDLICK